MSEPLDARGGHPSASLLCFGECPGNGTSALSVEKPGAISCCLQHCLGNSINAFVVPFCRGICIAGLVAFLDLRGEACVARSVYRASVSR